MVHNRTLHVSTVSCYVPILYVTILGTKKSVKRNEPVSHYVQPPTMPYGSQARDIELPERNYKAILHEYCQKNYLPLPEYVTEYPDDSIGFVSVLIVSGKEYRSKPCGSKKKAEQNVAGIAALDIGIVKINEISREGEEGPVIGSSATGSIGTSSVGGLGSSVGSRFSNRRATVSESEFILHVCGSTGYISGVYRQ